MNTDEPRAAEAWVLNWQTKFYRWATTNKNQKYEDVYNLLYDTKTLQMAWRHVRANKGSKTAGVDGHTRAYVEVGLGEDKFLRDIQAELKAETYRPRPTREKSIPKPNGKVRYLGIPTLRDRVVQQALRMILEPIFEADFYRSSYAYRPNRRTQDAIEEIFQFAKPRTGYEWVVEGDIQGCFDNVHHGILMEEIRKRVIDRKIIRLIRAFLKSGVMTEFGMFRHTVTGTPQGGILSPLLANIYLSRLDQYFLKKWESYGDANGRQRFRKKGLATCTMVRFADDFVILTKGTRAQAEALKEETAQFLKRDLSMELSLEKTRITHVTEGFDFLGHHIVLKANYSGRMSVRIYPSKKSLRTVQKKVKVITSQRTTGQSLGQILAQLNAVLRGWSNYFRFSHSKRTFSYLGDYAWRRVHRWMSKKHGKLSLTTLQRKYFPEWTFQEGNQTLFNPGQVVVERYKYRGALIPTVWSDQAGCLKRKGRRDHWPDEPRLLENLESCCTL